MEPISVVIVLTTLPADLDPAVVARQLVGERLAACVSAYAPMTSFYRWEGAVQEGSERQLVIKTNFERLPALAKRLEELHPYKVPEFMVVFSSATTSEYQGWVNASVTQDEA